MDLTVLFSEVGKLSEIPFKDTLYKDVSKDFYYIIDFSKKADIWVWEVNQIESSRNDIGKKLKLYDQPANSKIGCSFAIASFFGRNRLLNILDYANRENLLDLSDLIEHISKDTFLYPETEDEGKEWLLEQFKTVSGYATLSINGHLLINLDGYDDKVICDIYKSMKKRIVEGDFCYLCGSIKKDDLIEGAIKEPAWKLLTTTRTSDLSSGKKTFVRCMSCEENLMKGIYQVRQLSRYEVYKSKRFEVIHIPLTRDKRIWDLLTTLRKDYSSDLSFYESFERLLERLERRGLSEIVSLRILNNQRSSASLDIDVYPIENFKRLRSKEEFSKFLWDLGFYPNGKEVFYYPPELLSDKRDYRWKYIDRLKRYWLGVDNEKISLIDEIERFLNLLNGELSIYKLWSVYLEKGDSCLKSEIYNSKNYALGIIMKLARDLYSYGSSKKDSSIKRRFYGYPKDRDYALNELLKAIDIKSRWLKKEERLVLEKALEIYSLSDFEGDISYYYLALNSSKLGYE